jgi:hypothetical protein
MNDERQVQDLIDILQDVKIVEDSSPSSPSSRALRSSNDGVSPSAIQAVNSEGLICAWNLHSRFVVPETSDQAERNRTTP